MTPPDGNSVQLLHALGFLYGQYGQSKRGLVLLLLAARLEPDNPKILRTLVHLLLTDGAPERALAVIARLEGLEGGDVPGLLLLKARALWAAGREVEARHLFREFLAQRPR